jgi:hypothetical protein
MDLNHRPLGYECNKIRNFNNLQGTDSTQRHRKELQGTVIVPLLFPQILGGSLHPDDPRRVPNVSESGEANPMGWLVEHTLLVAIRK